MWRKLIPILIISAVFAWAGMCRAATFVAEATNIIDQVKVGSTTARESLEDFYRVFSRYAAKMVELENKIKRWQQEGYLCKEYEKCPEKWDLIYATYRYYMRQIEKAFYEHRGRIQAAFAELHKTVYQNIDRLKDMKMNLSRELSFKLKELEAEQQDLEQEKAELERKCPPSNTSRLCRMKWRSFDRRARLLNRRLRRLVMMKRTNALVKKLKERLVGILEGFSDWEDKATDALFSYASLFSEYEMISGVSGIGKIISSIDEIRKLSQRLDELVEFSKGLELHIGEVNNIVERKLRMAEKSLGIVSTTGEIKHNTKVLEENKRLLETLKQG